MSSTLGSNHFSSLDDTDNLVPKWRKKYINPPCPQTMANLIWKKWKERQDRNKLENEIYKRKKPYWKACSLCQAIRKHRLQVLFGHCRHLFAFERKQWPAKGGLIIFAFIYYCAIIISVPKTILFCLIFVYEIL